MAERGGTISKEWPLLEGVFLIVNLEAEQSPGSKLRTLNVDAFGASMDRPI